MKRWHVLTVGLAAILALALFRGWGAPTEAPPRRAARAPEREALPVPPPAEGDRAAAEPATLPETTRPEPVVAVVAPPPAQPAQPVTAPAPGAPPNPDTGEDATEAWLRISLVDLTDEDRAVLDRHLMRFVRQRAVEAREAVGLLASPDDRGAVERRRVEQLELLRQRNALGLLDHIASALAWFALHQGPDGAITESSAAARCEELGHRPACTLKRETDHQLGAASTGLAIIAMLDFRDQDKQGIFEPTLARAVTSLRRQQQADGMFPGGNSASYVTAISLLALGQAAASSGSDELRAAVQRGLAALYRRRGRDGGYRYDVQEEGDLSVSAWVAQAVEAARRAKVEIPEDMEAGLRRFLDAVWVRDFRFLYTARGQERASLYPAGILLGLIEWDVPGSWRCSGDAVRDTWRKSLERGPWRGAWARYSFYYSVRVLCALEPEIPKAWSQAILGLAAEQASSGSRAGSFGDTLRHGVVIDTAFATLTLEHALYRR